MSETLKVESRELRGKRNNRRLRARGRIPAVLYGHGQDPVSLAVPAEQFDSMVRHGSRLVTLAGAVNESAFIRECQWDTWGHHVVHVDFTRISAHEKVRVQVAIELRGEAPGVKEGGVLKQVLHEIELECEAADIPEKLTVSINDLGLNGSVTVANLALPPGAKVFEEPDQHIVQCVEPAEQPEVEEVSGEVEPELIGRKREEEGEASGS
ncbi:MAG: 50S ribosomal protein L25 [Planctomycetaceae bacterium]|nr:50S ribosomal protein L25 [Planctomycetaceae bacterium]